MTRDKNAEKIAALNDALRKDPYSGRHGHIVMTRSVAALGSAFTWYSFVMNSLASRPGLSIRLFDFAMPVRRQHDHLVIR